MGLKAPTPLGSMHVLSPFARWRHTRCIVQLVLVDLFVNQLLMPMYTRKNIVMHSC